MGSAGRSLKLRAIHRRYGLLQLQGSVTHTLLKFKEASVRTLDLTPLFRSSVGFDRMTSMLETASRMDANPANTYPPYNIERQSDEAYRITMAVAGFTLDDLEIEIQDQALTVRGRQGEKVDDDASTHYLHRGIATRAFERRFHLAEQNNNEKKKKRIKRKKQIR